MILGVHASLTPREKLTGRADATGLAWKSTGELMAYGVLLFQGDYMLQFVSGDGSALSTL